MNIESKTILITGANRGVDRALVEETLNRGAKRVYGGTRQPFKHSDQRVTPVILDVTNAEQIQKAIESIANLDILVNNAGIDPHDDLSDRAGIERHLAVNLFGTHGVTQAFLPLLVRSQGAIVNVLSLAALASTVQSGIRDLEGGCVLNDAIAACSLGGTWCEVHAVFAGSVDTDMTRSLDIPKASPEYVARAILDGMERREEDIFPDPMSAGIAAGWRSSVSKMLERQFSDYAPENMAKRA